MTVEEALAKAARVASEGRISNDRRRPRYCLHTHYFDGVHVDARITKTGADGFRVYKENI